MTASSRSRQTLADGMTRWLRSRHPDEDLVDVTIDRPQPGLSSDTLFADITLGTHQASYVVRLPPLGDHLFPDYSLDNQAAIQTALADSGLPVVKPLAIESDPSFLGAPFFLMPRVTGRTLTTSPPYPGAGWLAESSPDQQQDVLETFIDLLADVHRLPVDRINTEHLSGGGPALSGMLDYWTTYLDWATEDHAATGIYRTALKWLRGNQPDPAPPSLLWGDPQLTNCVFGPGGEVAALDWEMASLGPAEVDLSWFLTLHEQSGETAGTTLAGDPGRAPLIARYEQRLGRPVGDLNWYDAFANLRSGLIVLRVGELLAARGIDRHWTQQVPQPRHLERLLTG